jgi:hypothetical protein
MYLKKAYHRDVKHSRFCCDPTAEVQFSKEESVESLRKVVVMYLNRGFEILIPIRRLIPMIRFVDFNDGIALFSR